jgi:simple sugar transport system substrate-binding protein
MKCLIRSAFAATVAFFVLTATARAEPLKFIYVSHGQANDSFHSVVKNGTAAAAKDLGVQVDYRSPQTFDMVAMSQLIDAAVNQKPDGLIVTIPDGDALAASIKRAAEAGIPIIGTNCGKEVARKLGVKLFIGQDEYLAAKLAGERLKAAGGKKAICVNVEPGNVTLDIRCKGFAEGFGGKVTVLPTSLDPTENVSKIRAALEADPALDTVMGTAAPYAGEPAVEAVHQLGKEGKVHVATFDLSPGILKDILEGKAEFAIDQQQFLYGYLPVVLLKLYHDYGLMPAADITSGPLFVTKDNAAQVEKLSSEGIR